MPGRPIPLSTGEIYHLFNRGNNRQDIFYQTKDYKRFINTFCYYRFSDPKPSFSDLSKKKLNNFYPTLKNKYVEILCYTLMPNHFHFLIKQLRENGISIFMSQVCNSYTKYINTRYKRSGSLLQGTFKSVRITTDEQLIHTSRYIHLNPIVSSLAIKDDYYPWSSYPEYIHSGPQICSTSEVLNFFPSTQKYQEFTMAQVNYGKTLAQINHNLIENGHY